MAMEFFTVLNREEASDGIIRAFLLYVPIGTFGR